MWGQVTKGSVAERHIRIIPMRVGTRNQKSRCITTARDHPHACGDKVMLGVPATKSAGSSPCVWGQDSRTFHTALPLGIIPMRVGTRYLEKSIIDFSQDHPHACGDKGNNSNRLLAGQGSSPCVWGQVTSYLSHFLGRRIIPMRVGTRLKKSRKIAVLQNQPLRFPLTFHRSFV